MSSVSASWTVAAASAFLASEDGLAGFSAAASSASRSPSAASSAFGWVIRMYRAILDLIRPL